MSDKPIPFSGPMVQAILDGRKTQTRQVINPQPDEDKPFRDMYGDEALFQSKTFWRQFIKCPYGQPGDTLWVKESWKLWSNATDWYTVSYAADDHATVYPVKCERDLKILSSRGKKNSLWMPREFSRITLEVVGVRVERVQEITEADAKAEGVSPMTWINHPENAPAYRVMFQPLWDLINKKRGLFCDANPFVWMVEFKMIPNPVPCHSLYDQEQTHTRRLADGTLHSN